MFIHKSFYVKSIDDNALSTDILSMKKSFFRAFLVFFGLAPCLFGAEIVVPNLELASRGAMINGDFGIASSIQADIALTGGYKYGITLGLGAEILNLEKALSYRRLELLPAFADPPTKAEYDVLVSEMNDRYNNQAYISIRSIKATIRELFGSPLEMSFFVGRHDKLASGDEFVDYFGTDPIATGLKGFFYYPEGLNNDPFLRFNGAIHSILGTGLAFKAYLGNFIPALYLYQDLSFYQNPGGSYLPGCYSGDFRLLYNGEKAKFEMFFGGTYRKNYDAVLRGGAMAWFGADSLSLLFQAGISYWEAGASIDIDNCYFLMEPRLRLEKMGVNLTFFYHPVYFMNQEIMEGGKQANGRADINVRIFFGDLNKSAFEAGLETLVNMKVQDGENLTLWISPFVSAVTSGLHWNCSVRFNPRYFWDKGDLMEAFIMLRTSF